ncbi:hypothetical protein [Segatella buccae]|uniref:hypothetical protein n=1 Tax=Segatella buccae TaxID=28126 RepID=UPI0028E9846F|nr:hypothetical protein [Segatella buccae]
MKYHIKTVAIWMRRIRHSRGFGVQSPWAYRFIRYVVNEHYPYYAFAELEQEMGYAGKLANKMGRLYFRLANYLQPRVVFSFYSNRIFCGERDILIVDKKIKEDGTRDFSGIYEKYLKRGCRNTEIISLASTSDADVSDAKDILGAYTGLPLVRMAYSNHSDALFEEVASAASEDTVLIIEGIMKSRMARNFWKKVKRDMRTGITFDLYYCGIVFFDHTRFKQHYLVNF